MDLSDVVKRYVNMALAEALSSTFGGNSATAKVAFPKAVFPMGALPKAAIPKAAFPKGALPKVAIPKVVRAPNAKPLPKPKFTVSMRSVVIIKEVPPREKKRPREPAHPPPRRLLNEGAPAEPAHPPPRHLLNKGAPAVGARPRGALPRNVAEPRGSVGASIAKVRPFVRCYASNRFIVKLLLCSLVVSCVFLIVFSEAMGTRTKAMGTRAKAATKRAIGARTQSFSVPQE